jgi:hypothetical protein
MAIWIDNMRWRFWRWNYRRTMRKAQKTRIAAAFNSVMRAR